MRTCRKKYILSPIYPAMGDAIMARDGFMAVPQGPGLGVEIDEDVIARYRAG